MIRFSSPTPKRSTLIATSQNAWYPQTVFSYNCVCVCELIMTTSLHSTITHGRARNDKEIFGKASSTMQEFCRKKNAQGCQESDYPRQCSCQFDNLWDGNEFIYHRSNENNVWHPMLGWFHMLKCCDSTTSTLVSSSSLCWGPNCLIWFLALKYRLIWHLSQKEENE